MMGEIRPDAIVAAYVNDMQGKGYRRLESTKFASRCLKCTWPIKEGDPSLWLKGSGIVCLDPVTCDQQRCVVFKEEVA